MDIDFTTSESSGGDVQMPATENKEPTEAAKSELKPMEASPVSSNQGDTLKQKLETYPASTAKEEKTPTQQPPVALKENEAPFPPLENSQNQTAQKPKGKGGLIWTLIIILILGGVAYFFLGTSQGKSMIGLAPIDDLSGLYLTEENTNDMTFPSTTSGLSSPSSSTSSSRDSQRKQDLSSIKMYIDQYYTKNSKYPVAPVIEKINDTSSIIYQALIPNITTSLSNDPWADDYGYWYGYRSDDGTSYYLTARLEDTADPSGKLEDQNYIYRLLNSGEPASTSATTSTSSTSSSIENDLGV